MAWSSWFNSKTAVKDESGVVSEQSTPCPAPNCNQPVDLNAGSSWSSWFNKKTAEKDESALLSGKSTPSPALTNSDTEVIDNCSASSSSGSGWFSSKSSSSSTMLEDVTVPDPEDVAEQKRLRRERALGLYGSCVNYLAGVDRETLKRAVRLDEKIKAGESNPRHITLMEDCLKMGLVGSTIGATKALFGRASIPQFSIAMGTNFFIIGLCYLGGFEGLRWAGVKNMDSLSGHMKSGFGAGVVIGSLVSPIRAFQAGCLGSVVAASSTIGYTEYKRWKLKKAYAIVKAKENNPK